MTVRFEPTQYTTWLTKRSFSTSIASPLSAEAHSMWNHIARFNLRTCKNLLHRYHRIPEIKSFSPNEPGLRLSRRDARHDLRARGRSSGKLAARVVGADAIAGEYTRESSQLLREIARRLVALVSEYDDQLTFVEPGVFGVEPPRAAERLAHTGMRRSTCASSSNERPCHRAC